MNYKAPFFLLQAFNEQVGQGSVVNILDNKIAFNQFHYAGYLGAKKALAELTRMAALEFAPRIRVNGIAPGVILPAATRGDRYLQWRHDGIPLSGIGHPDHICSTLHYILTNAFVTGQGDLHRWWRGHECRRPQRSELCRNTRLAKV